MRPVLALLCLSGCQLVFDPPSVQPDGAPDSAEPDAPTTRELAVSLAFDRPSPLLAGSTHDVAISVAGQPGRQVYFSVELDPPSAGTVTPIEPIVLGSVTTIAHAKFTAAAEYGAGRVVVTASYAPDLRDPELVDLSFELHQLFGNVDPGGDELMPGNTLFAYPIDIPKAGQIERVTVFGSPATAAVRVAIYTEISGRPGLLISDPTPPAHLLASTTAVETTFPITPVNVDTRFWLVLKANGPVTLQATTADAGVPITATTSFDEPFDGLFPAGGSSHSQPIDFRYYVTVGP